MSDNPAAPKRRRIDGTVPPKRKHNVAPAPSWYVPRTFAFLALLAAPAAAQLLLKLLINLTGHRDELKPLRAIL